MIIVIVLLGFSIGYNIYQYKEIKRLDDCWNDLFNAKIETDKKWQMLCNHYLKKIDELTKKDKKNDNTK